MFIVFEKKKEVKMAGVSIMIVWRSAEYRRISLFAGFNYRFCSDSQLILSHVHGSQGRRKSQFAKVHSNLNFQCAYSMATVHNIRRSLKVFFVQVLLKGIWPNEETSKKKADWTLWFETSEKRRGNSCFESSIFEKNHLIFKITYCDESDVRDTGTWNLSRIYWK